MWCGCLLPCSSHFCALFAIVLFEHRCTHRCLLSDDRWTVFGYYIASIRRLLIVLCASPEFFCARLQAVARAVTYPPLCRPLCVCSMVLAGYSFIIGCTHHRHRHDHQYHLLPTSSRIRSIIFLSVTGYLPALIYVEKFSEADFYWPSSPECVAASDPLFTGLTTCGDCWPWGTANVGYLRTWIAEKCGYV